MTFASRILRRAEIALWVMGISLLGVALGATLYRWHYQTQQERAMLAQMSVASPALAASEFNPTDIEAPPQRKVVADFVGPVAPPASIETIGPTKPAGLEPAAQSPSALLPQVKEPAPRRAAAVEKPKAPPAFGRIEIPRIGVRAIVQEGSDEKTLARAVGLIPEGARPGESGNVVLAGHRDTFFWPLRKIKVNDRIRVVVPPNEYEYKVDAVRIVEPEETEVLQSRGVEELTLVTCYPFRFVGPSPDRFIVSASRVQ
jgi:sortase A